MPTNSLRRAQTTGFRSRFRSDDGKPQRSGDTIMIQENPQVDRFKEQMRESLRQETLHSRAITVAKHDNVYTCGDNDELVYFIESGQIKLLMVSPEGKECLLAIHSTGDMFGELCLSGSISRLETATAMEETVLKQIPCSRFFARLGRDKLFEQENPVTCSNRHFPVSVWSAIAEFTEK